MSGAPAAMTNTYDLLRSHSSTWPKRVGFVLAVKSVKWETRHCPASVVGDCCSYSGGTMVLYIVASIGTGLFGFHVGHGHCSFC